MQSMPTPRLGRRSLASRRRDRVVAESATAGRPHDSLRGGDIHGAIDRLYEDIIAFESSLGLTFDWVLHVGDFGIWPDPSRIDRATRRHDGADDFPRWYAERRAVPRSTVFIKGNHQDFVWLDSRPDGEALPGLRYFRNGEVADLAAGGEVLRVAGLGGCYGPSDFERPSRTLQGYAKRHYTRDEIAALSAREGDRHPARARRAEGRAVR